MDGAMQIDVEALQEKYAEERDKRLRHLSHDPYPELKGKFASFDRDPYADPDFEREPVTDEVDVLIIGGGVAGLMAGVRLRQQGVRSLRVIDKGGDFGGTWYWNRYPGAACDIESYIYFPLLEETGYMPSERYAGASEIQAYLQRLAAALRTLRWRSVPDRGQRTSLERRAQALDRKVRPAGRNRRALRAHLLGPAEQSQASQDTRH